MIKRVVLIVIAAALVIGVGCSDSPDAPTGAERTLGFIQTDLVIGNGAEAIKGKTVSVHYTGWLYDDDAPDNKGVKFDSSYDRGALFDFPLGAGRVIKGWDRGVAGMRVGGKRTLVIPSNLAYGERGAGRLIPANATLVFDIELFNVR